MHIDKERSMSEQKDELSDEVAAKYEDLCRELNMDRETEEMAWKFYSEVAQRSSLEGNVEHWFCCALYCACRESYRPTVGESNAVVKGNCVSIMKLLRSCNMSIYQFFKNIKVWIEMAELDPGLNSYVEELERKFAVTWNIFINYTTMYDKMFLSSQHEKKNTKYRSAAKCSSNKLYDLCWCLYLCVKNEDPVNYPLDLVTCIHLLLCCLDLVFRNVLAERRFDLINPDFKGLPENWNSPDFDPSTISSERIIQHLWTKGSIVSDVIVMKENAWTSIISKFFKTETIFGNKETFLDMLSNMHFDRNLKSLNSAYEQYFLSVGELDERIMLNNPAHRKSEIDESRTDEVRSLIPETPYTRKHSLPSKDGALEPIASATNNIKKLKELEHIIEPTDYIKEAGEEALRKIDDKINQFWNLFRAELTDEHEASIRFNLARSLYFYLLEKITQNERRIKPNINLKDLLQNETFLKTLLACCIEIVLAAYDSQQKFPWVLTCFGINAFEFYKIIELVVRHQSALTRELLKHLNYIEETCLQELVWQETSPLWRIIQMCSPLPSWSEVDVANISRGLEPQVQSPMNSVCDTFNMPSTSESARRDLFNTAKEHAAEKTEKTEEIVNRQAEGRRAKSLSLFLRKFYKLAWLRIRELCMELGMENKLTLDTIWTLFEHSIIKTELIRNRHLDQILMCAIYLYIRLKEIKDKSFTDVMKFYRKQPQAASSTYRAVLIEPIADANNKSNAQPEYGDLIKFYNFNYVPKMTPYAFKFTEKNKSQHELLRLSPHPTEKSLHPTKPSNNHSLYVYTMEKNGMLHSPDHNLTLEFGKSPGKKFSEAIQSGKRHLSFNNNDKDADDDSVVRSKIIRKQPIHMNKIIGVMQDRRDEPN